MVDSIPYLVDEKAIALFERHKVLNRVELHSRSEILYETYIKQINIEARAMIDIASKQLRPAIVKYAGEVATSLAAMKAAGFDASVEEELLMEINDNMKAFQEALKHLSEVTQEAAKLKNNSKLQAIFYRDQVFKVMEELRKPADRLEFLVDEKAWPFPTYGELLYNV